MRSAPIRFAREASEPASHLNVILPLLQTVHVRLGNRISRLERDCVLDA